MASSAGGGGGGGGGGGTNWGARLDVVIREGDDAGFTLFTIPAGMRSDVIMAGDEADAIQTRFLNLVRRDVDAGATFGAEDWKYFVGEAVWAALQAGGTPTACPYCRIPLNENTVSMDRIDNTGVHTPDNVILACSNCNLARGNRYSVNEFVTVCAGVRAARGMGDMGAATLHTLREVLATHLKEAKTRVETLRDALVTDDRAVLKQIVMQRVAEAVPAPDMGEDDSNWKAAIQSAVVDTLSHTEYGDAMEVLIREALQANPAATTATVMGDSRVDAVVERAAEAAIPSVKAGLM